MQWEFASSDATTAQSRRRDFVAFLRQYGTAESDFSAAELIFGELIANVVRHAPGPISIRVEWPRDFPTLHVQDAGNGFNWKPALPSDPFTECQRGLYLVGKFARDITVENIPSDGSRVSVVLPVRRRSAAAADLRGRPFGG